MDPLGDERDASRIKFPVTTEGVDVDVFADYVLVRVGRAIGLVQFIDVLSAFDEDVSVELTGRVVRRLDAATD
jgi:hypothetical protein